MTIVALEQFDAVPGRVEVNVSEIEARARRALANGAHIVVFPELASSGYVCDPTEVARVAEPLDGPFVGRMSKLCEEFSGGLAVSGFCEVEGGDYYNTVVVVGPDGPLLHYRKLHLFDREHLAYTPGDSLPLLETDFGTLGVCVCYDLRFVEVLRVLSLRGADIVVAPAAWVAGFDQQVPADGMTRQAEAVVTQANLDQVAVVAVSQVSSTERDGLRTLGGSVAVDAHGDLLCGPLSRSEGASAAVTVDVTRGRKARVRGERIRPRADRRTDVYGVTYGEEAL